MDEGPVITIRPFQAGDLASLRAMYARTPPSGNESTDPQPWPDDLERIGETYLAVWVAVSAPNGKEQVIGMVGATPPGPEMPDRVLRRRPGAVQLRRMRVAPEWQRRGIGMRLTETVIDWARSQAAPAVILETTAEQVAAVELYRRMGFAEVGRSTVGPYDLVWFERTLAPAPS